MPHRKIIIIGSPGSGKTTLAKAIGQKLSLPITHLDKLWWKDNWQHISREEFDEKLSHILQQKRYIIDGDYSRTLPMRLASCDTVIYLDFSRWVCIKSALLRIIKNHGISRSDMGPNCPEKLDLSFLTYIWNFNKNNRNTTYALLHQYNPPEVYTIKKRRHLSKFIEEF